MSRPLKYSIPGITRILAIIPSGIPFGADLMSESGLPVAIGCDAREIPFVGEAVCNIQEIHSASGISYKSELEFHSLPGCGIPAARCWIVFDFAGQATLFGARNHPYPGLHLTGTTGELSGRSDITVKVSCITPPIECVFTGKVIP